MSRTVPKLIFFSGEGGGTYYEFWALGWALIRSRRLFEANSSISGIYQIITNKNYTGTRDLSIETWN